MRISIYIATSLSALLFSGKLTAQTAPSTDTILHRTVVVEQEYLPELTDARKVNAMPEIEPLNVAKRQVEYDDRLMPATTLPMGVMKPYRAFEPSEQTARGYARLGYGNGGNIDATAAYRFDFNSRHTLGLDMTLNGMNRSIDLCNSTLQQSSWDAYAYRTHATVGYQHRFTSAELNTSIHFEHHNFNLTPYSPAHKQKFTEGNWHVGVASTRHNSPISYLLQTNLMLYQRAADQEVSKQNETLLRTKGVMTGRINSEQQISIGAYIDNYFYNRTLDAEAVSAPLTDFTALTLHPLYIISHGVWHLQAGVKLDLSSGADKTFRVAPDIKAELQALPSTVIYAQITGGKQQNDFRRMEAVSPYGMISAQKPNIQSTYETLDATIGVKTSPLPELSLHAFGGYRELRNDLFVNNCYSTNSEAEYVNTLAFEQANSYQLYAGACADYDYKKIFALHASLTCHRWESGYRTPTGAAPTHTEALRTAEPTPDPEQALTFKPALQADLQLDLHCIEPLQIKVGYNYLSYTGSRSSTPRAVNNLYVHASYRFMTGISAYLLGRNLLNKSYQVHPYIPEQGVNVLGGLSFVF